MKKIIFTLSVLFSSQIYAQNLSLEKAFELANDPNYEQAEMQVLIEEINLKIQKNKRLPLIYGDVNLQRNLIVPTTPVPAIAFNPNAEPGEIIPLKFATDWSSKAGLQASIDLFNPQNKLSIKQAENQLKKSKLDKNKKAFEFQNLISDLYAQTVLAQQQYDLALLIEATFNESFDIIQKRYESGRTSDLERNAALQKAIELEMNTTEAAFILKNKYLQLSNYFDISGFDYLSTPIEKIISKEIMNNTFDIKQLKLEIESKQIEIENNKLTAMPKLSLNAFYGTQFYDNQFNLTNGNKWFGNSYVNLTLRIPLTENYGKSLFAKQLNQELSLSKSKLEALELDKEISNDIKSNEISNLEQRIQSYKKIVKIAEENVKIAKNQLDEGTILISDYNKELENLLNQNKKVWQTSYDLLLKTQE